MSPDAPSPAGLLVAIVGPSGAGKDTLIRLALERLGDEPRICLARRVITRPSDKAAEDHDTLDEAAFARAEDAGAFCLTWRAHGLSYGLPRSIEDKLREGALVLANLSRRSLADATRRFGRVAVVEITAPREVLVERIHARGRETAEEVEKRLAWQTDAQPPSGAVRFLSIDNSGPPSAGADRLHRHLLALLNLSAGDATSHADISAEPAADPRLSRIDLLRSRGG